MPTKRRKHHRKLPRIRNSSPGEGIPGELVFDESANDTSLHLIKYDRNKIEEHDIERVSQISDLICDSCVTWVNVNGLGNVKTLQELSELFRLHRMAVEDVVNVNQRPKVEEYDDHLLLILKVISIDPSTNHLNSQQVSIFFGDNYILTFQEHADDYFDPVRERLRSAKGRVRELGADYLAYALLDAVVDAYYPIVDVYGERLERLDELLSAGHPGNFMGVIHNTRGDLTMLRRAIRPLRDELLILVRDSHTLISKETIIYLRDCYDHGYQLIDMLDNYRDMCSDLRDYYLSIVNNRMNEVMKVLTITSTIFIPLSFIVGLYGMNFNPQLPGNMPELNWPYGYVYALLLMLAIASGLMYFVWRMGWLSSMETRVNDFDVIQPDHATSHDALK